MGSWSRRRVSIQSNSSSDLGRPAVRRISGSTIKSFGSQFTRDTGVNAEEDGDVKVVHFVYSDAVVQALHKMGVTIHIIQTPDPRYRNKKPPRGKSGVVINRLPEIYSDVRKLVGSRDSYYVMPSKELPRGSRAGSLPNTGYYASGNLTVPGKSNNDYMLGSTKFKPRYSLPAQALEQHKRRILEEKKKVVKLPPLTKR